MKRAVTFAGLLTFAAVASGQLSASHLYNGIRRPLEITVNAPRARSLTVRLLDPMDGGAPKLVGEAPVEPGRNDLAARFPQLWAATKPRLLYAQLVADGVPFGSALVLQPMTNPPVARLSADGKSVVFVPDEDHEYAGIRVYPDRQLIFDTSLGKMVFRLRPDCAPNTVFNIRELVEGGLYTDTIWHRIVAHRADGSPFVIQGGDPAGTGSGGAGYAYALEASPLPHDFGVISIARSADPNTNGCQVFVCLSRAGTRHLDGKYASFGELVKGADTLLRIAAVPVGKNDRPLSPPVIYHAVLVPAPPFGTGPMPMRHPEAERFAPRTSPTGTPKTP